MGTGVHLIKLSIRSKASVLQRRPKFSMPTLSGSARRPARICTLKYSRRASSSSMRLSVKRIAEGAAKNVARTSASPGIPTRRSRDVEKFDANEAKVRRRFSATR